MSARPRSPVVLALTLLSGGVMALAGYVAHEESWGMAGFVAIPAGGLIVVAHALAGSGRQPPALVPTALTLLSGALMVLAGYVAAGGDGLAAGAIAVAGGLVILPGLAASAARSE